MLNDEKKNMSESDLKIDVGDTIILREQLRGKRKQQGVKKPLSEFIIGADLHQKSGKWNHKHRIIDRETDRYTEIITDPETQEIIHRCEEPLSKHKDHGSAKKGSIHRK
jgi:hypothetical protein